MMKFYSLFLAAVLCCASYVQADEPQTVHIGINNASLVGCPVAAKFADSYYCSQTLYLSDSLSGMENKTITKLAFFLKAVNPNGDYESVEIRLLEVDYNELAESNSSTSFKSIEGATLVYEGSLPAKTTTNLEVELSTPFDYKGGNLLVDVRKTVRGGAYAPVSGSAGRFQGTKCTAYMCLYNYSTSVFPTMASPITYFADVTFTFEEPIIVTCDKPANLAIDAKDAHSATFSWDEVEDANWQYICLPKSDEPNWDSTAVVSTQEHSTTIENLKSDTEYKFHVRRYCAEDDQSTAASIAFKTDKSCFTPTSLYIPEELTTDQTAKITWKTSGHGETQYQYTYDSYNWTAIEPDWSKAVVTDQLEVTLTGLTPESMYQIWVRSYCSEDDQSEAVTEYFATTEAAPTGISNTEVKTNASKRIENGVLIIDNNGTLYNAQGTRLTK